MWLPYGQAHLRSFIESYQAFPAGDAHELYILFNGVRDPQEVAGSKAVLDGARISYKVLEIPQGQDITAYFFAASVLTEKYVLFLNTWSRFLQPAWLSKYRNAITSSPIMALVGATASWQSYYSTVFQTHSWKWEKEKGFAYNYRKYKLFIKALLYWSTLFKSFPNPHIRSNAFMVRRDVFLQLDHGPLQTKFQAYLFESGRNGMTAQFQKKGYEIAVIDKNGRLYPLEECKNVGMFWTDQQENLLVSDNQTTKYDEALIDEKKKLNHLAWGD